jgi:hypothetical protein
MIEINCFKLFFFLKIQGTVYQNSGDSILKIPGTVYLIIMKQKNTTKRYKSRNTK